MDVLEMNLMKGTTFYNCPFCGKRTRVDLSKVEVGQPVDLCGCGGGTFTPDHRYAPYCKPPGVPKSSQ